MATYEITGSIGKQVRRIALQMRLIHAAVQVMFPIVVVRVVIDVSGHVSEEFVKSTLCRSRTGRKSNVPFTKTPTAIPDWRKHLRNQRLTLSQTNAVVPCNPGKLN